MYLKPIVISAFSIVCIIGLGDCKSSKSSTVPPKEFLRFGSGGGFAGKETIQSLFEDGSWSSSAGGKFQPLKKNQLRQLETNIQILGLENMDYNSPGNLYEFIEIKSGSDFRRMAWDPMSESVPSALKLFYNNLSNLFQNSKK